MKNDGPGGYVDKVREQMQLYVRGLLEDNEALRVGLAELENENVRLREELRALRQDLAAASSQHQHLLTKLQEIRAESERRYAAYAKLEQINANLCNLYVASYRLHGTLSRRAVLEAIEEIIVNLIGSEQFAVFERDGSNEFLLSTSVGVGPVLPVMLHPRVVEATTIGETWVAPTETDEGLAACVPLRVDGRVTGFIAILSLLAHKSTIEPLDLELFDLLATHAAIALYSSSLQERLGEQ